MRQPPVDEARLRREAVDLWTADRGVLVFKQPLNATLALYLDLVAVIDERLPTAATDGRAVYVNPYWLTQLSPQKRLFVLAHEVWHNALLHGRRQGERDPERWNVAIDHEVNALLGREGFMLPGDAIYFPQWSHLEAERVYDELVTAGQRPSRPAGADVHLETEPALGGPTDGLSEAEFGPLRGRFDAAYPARIDREAADAWSDRIVALRSQLAGKLPGTLVAVVEALVEPKLPWQALLRDFVLRTCGGRLQWLPPSRRHVHRGVYLPSRRDDVLRLAVAIDTSGSVSAEQPRFLGELQRIAASFGRYELRVLLCDAEVRRDERSDEARPLPVALLVEGGGGTDFTPVFRVLAADPPAGLLFFTDGVGPAPAEPPPYPVAWVLTAHAEPPVPWGRAVWLD